MGLGEPVARELRQALEQRQRDRLGHSPAGGAVQEPASECLHPFARALTGHSAPEGVRLLGGEARQGNGRSHNLLLVHECAKGLGEDRLQVGVEVRHRLAAGAAEQEKLLHAAAGRTRADEGDRQREVLDAIGVHRLEQRSHPRALYLEYAQRAPFSQQPERVGVPAWEPVRLQGFTMDLPGPRRGVLDDREPLLTKDIHLDEAQPLDGPHVVLRYDQALGGTLQRDQFGERPVRYHHPSHVDREVAGEPVQPVADVQYAPVRLAVQGEVAAGWYRPGGGLYTARPAVGESAGERVYLLTRQPHGPGHVPDGHAGLHGGVGAYHRHPVAPEPAVDVREHLVTAAPAYVEVDVGRALPGR